MYRGCSEREINDLIEAIRGGKYWAGLLGSKDVIYVVALTRAKIRIARGFQARATYIDKAEVSESAAPYCKRGRILAMVKEDSHYVARSVIPWPIFLRIMRGLQDEIYNLIVSNRIPPYVNRNVIEALTGVDRKTLAQSDSGH